MLVVLLACALAGVKASSQPPVVSVEQGAVRGSYLTSLGGRQYVAFRGIPYAQPPVGEYRFKEPSPLTPWQGVWDASEYGSGCLQYDFTFSPEDPRLIGDEDCLFINVYTPKIPPQKENPLLDVLVFIHGGGFMNGQSTFYGAKHYLDHDVVVVTFNYRLGILGFLSTGDEVVPGNNGLKDQATALRWIQTNIAAFGGDPEKVTITGLSAGGASVNYHYLSPWSKGLFSRGVSISGSSLTCWAQDEDHVAKAKQIAVLLGCSSSSSQEMVDCLRNRPARKIVQQTPHFQPWRYNSYTPFGPTVEVAGSNPFISKNPIDIILEGGAEDLPWMTSVTTEEGLYPVADFAENGVLKDLDKYFEDIAPHFLQYNFTVPLNKQKSVTKSIRKFYFGDGPISSKSFKQLIKLSSDRFFLIDVERAARLVASINKSPVYFYQFSYRGSDSQSNFMSKSNTNFGVAHGDDLAYLMDIPFSDTEQTEEDKKMINVLMDIYLNFAKKGDPTPSNGKVKWKPVVPGSKKLHYLNIASTTNLKMESSEDLGNRAFWDSLPIQERNVGVTAINEYQNEL